MTGEDPGGSVPPRRERGPVLVLGGTGFIGQALVQRLLALGVPVRVLVRDPARARRQLPPEVEQVPGDLVSGTGIGSALEGVRVAYYLVHSMGSAPGSFAERDRIAAHNFVDAESRSGLERVIYLGGLGDESGTASPHLASRREVGGILRAGRAELASLRAGIVVGAGSSSFEMMVQLAEHLPVMICPRWISSRCQPIALADLVRYLVGCQTVDLGDPGSLDAGGPEVLTYAEMLLRTGAALGRRPALLEVPRFTPSLSSHWVAYITSVPAGVARPIIEGMLSDAVCADDRLRTLLPGPLTPFRTAVARALEDRRALGRPPRLWGGHLLRPLEGRWWRFGPPPASRAGADPGPPCDGA